MRCREVLRKTVTLVAASALALGLFACGGSSASDTEGSGSSDEGNATQASLADASTTDVNHIANVTKRTALSLDDVATKPTLQSGTELSDEEAAQYDDESRAFETLPADSLLTNDAESFYYEDALTGDAAVVYQILKTVAQDPENAGNPASATSYVDPSSDEFQDIILTALFALTYDHPEFFWLYPSWMETGPEWAYHKNSGSDSWTVYFELSEPYANYEEEMTKFNDATEDFLADIDTTQSDQEIARQIHDKLIDQVTYDYDAMNSDNGNLAHTAYGALVEDSEGNAHYAVCDGYSLAYEYLLQQCGINATVVVGVGGDDESSGGHAWNAIELDGDWYETDSTWDDFGSTEDWANDNSDDWTSAYLLEALNDSTYRTKIDHYLYNVTTATMSDFEPDDSYLYYTKDGKYVICLTGESFHTKADDVDDYDTYDKTLMELAPEATATAFANE